jgi:hypothetical protein
VADDPDMPFILVIKKRKYAGEKLTRLDRKLSASVCEQTANMDFSLSNNLPCFRIPFIFPVIYDSSQWTVTVGKHRSVEKFLDKK